jgi:hypothetical protein
MVQILCGNPTAYSLERCDILLRRNKMGRPIKSKYFGNRNYPYDNEQTGGNSGVGGEKVAAVVISNSGTQYSAGTTAAFGAPNIKGGIQATASLEFGTNSNLGKIMSVTVTNAGSGYTAVPTLTLTTASTVTYASTGTIAQQVIYPSSTTGIYAGMKVIGTGISASATYVTSVASGAVNLSWPNAGAVTTVSSIIFVDAGASFAKTVTTTSNQLNALSIISYLTTGSSAISGGDIIKQESSRRYLVQNSQGVGQVKLSAGVGVDHTLAAGNMHLIATDGGGATYYVMKLTAHKAVVVNRTNTSTALISTSTLVIGNISYTGGDCGWTLGAAIGTNQVTLSNV